MNDDIAETHIELASLQTDDSKNISLIITPRTETLHDDIKQKINNTYKKDIDENLGARYRCRKAGHILEIISQLLSVSATILAFSAGFYNDKVLSFISGCLGSLSLATLKTAGFALKESKERTMSLNVILRRLNLPTIPEIVENN